MRNEDIKDLFDKWQGRCEDHAKRFDKLDEKLDKALEVMTKNREDIACIKAERRVIVWLAGVLGAVLTFIANVIYKKI